jgi:hypothetical protein
LKFLPDQTGNVVAEETQNFALSYVSISLTGFTANEWLGSSSLGERRIALYTSVAADDGS